MPSSRGSSQPRDWTQVSCITGRFFTIWATRKAHHVISRRQIHHHMIPLEGYTSIGGLSLRRFLDILADSFLARTYGNRALDGIAHFPLHLLIMGFPCGSAGKESACNAGDLGSIPGLERSPGEGKGYPLQCSGLENSMNSIVHRVSKSWTRLSDFHTLIILYTLSWFWFWCRNTCGTKYCPK